MRRSIIVVIAVALIAIPAFSATAMASKVGSVLPSHPVLQWRVLIQTVEDIWDILTGADGLTSITSKLDDIDDKLDAIASTASNVVMESGSGSLELEDSGGGFWGGWQVSGPYPEVRHISLTLYNPNEPDLWVWIRTHFETEDGEKVALIRYFEIGQGFGDTLQFDANKWAIEVMGGAGTWSSEEEYYLIYDYTVTYPGSIG